MSIPRKGRLHQTIKAVILTAFVISGCENNMEDVQALAREENTPVEKARDVELIYSDSGVVRMVLTAPLLERFAGDSEVVELSEGVKVIFYDSLMQEESRLTAEYAINREAQKLMEARRNVVVVNAKGETLNTEHLIWDAEKEMIRTEEFVKITTANEVIMGHGMESDQNFEKYRIFSVTAVLNMETDDTDAQDP